jgi:phosphatidylserine/phosphatidylglycerophosphate/cardiolipin synthase-like enzyme
MSMDLDPGEHKIGEVMDSLAAAAERGAQVTFGVDAYSFLYKQGSFGPLWYGRDITGKMAPVYSSQKAILDRINAAPHSSAHILNKPLHRYSMHVAGRSHIKLAIFDDEIIIPTANLTDQHYYNLAVSFRNRSTADWLFGVMTRAMKATSLRASLQDKDTEYRVDDTTSLYIDAGVRGQSRILDEVLAMIDGAKKWSVITCQYFPGGPTAKHLRSARQRGVDVKILYSDPASHEGLVVQFGNYADQALARLRNPSDMFQDKLAPHAPKMHAKVLVTEQGVLVGSHNYVTQGVRLGTAEIALKVSDTAFAHKMRAFVQEKLIGDQGSKASSQADTSSSNTSGTQAM